MEYNILDLNEEELESIENRLEDYDKKYISYKLSGDISIGIKVNDKLVAGANGCMTAFKIFYVSTVFVDEEYRRLGFGRLLIREIEKRAKELGANTIRLDTFNWQGKDFYLAEGYEQVGFYENKEDGFEEYFFIKRI